MRTGFTIHQRLPGLNEVIAANRTNKYAGAKLKKSTEEAICFEIIRAMRSGQLVPAGEHCCTVHIQWNEANMRRDADNIQSAQKFILDAMVKCGVIKNDSRKYISQIYHHINKAENSHNSVEVALDWAAETQGVI